MILMAPFQLEMFYDSVTLTVHLVLISAWNRANLKVVSDLPEAEDFTTSQVCVAVFDHLHRDFLLLQFVYITSCHVAVYFWEELSSVFSISPGQVAEDGC